MLLSSGGLGRSFTASFEATISQNGVKWFILHNAFRYRRSRAEISHSRQINFLRDPCGFESIFDFDQSREFVYVAGLRELALLRGLFQNKVNFNFTLVRTPILEEYSLKGACDHRPLYEIATNRRDGAHLTAYREINCIPCEFISC